MKLLGFSAQKPLYQAWQQDATLVRAWEAEYLPGDSCRSQSQRVQPSTLPMEHRALASDYHTGTTWAPIGETPVVEVTGYSHFSAGT